MGDTAPEGEKRAARWSPEPGREQSLRRLHSCQGDDRARRDSRLQGRQCVFSLHVGVTIAAATANRSPHGAFRRPAHCWAQAFADLLDQGGGPGEVSGPHLPAKLLTCSSQRHRYNEPGLSAVCRRPSALPAHRRRPVPSGGGSARDVLERIRLWVRTAT